MLPVSYAHNGQVVRMCVLYLELLADVAFNAVYGVTFTDQMLLIVIFVMQILLRVVILFTFFILLWQTELLRIGLLGMAFKKFKGLFIVSCVCTGILAAVRVPRLQGSTDEYLWDAGQRAGHVIHSFASVVFYYAYVKASLRLSLPDFYKPELWANAAVEIF
eukprot:GDKI01010659.1.p1 GENE.GDKI01010659.1~~GDKI01010659.1.p1  ORF type:complete len:162 (+),score=5.12 GDKI01010659.1:32-517(+)